MDNGDIDSVRAIFESKPNGRFGTPSHRLSWRRKAPWSNPQRLIKISNQDTSIKEIYPFGTSGGGIIAPPVHIPERWRHRRLAIFAPQLGTDWRVFVARQTFNGVSTA